MIARSRWLWIAAASALVLEPARAQVPGGRAIQSTPITLGETFTLTSTALGEPRRVNVYVPPAYGERPDARRPVLYMPDGGMAEDFLHVAGLVQVSVGNGTMRPIILVGIENTQRRRDMTGPTRNPEDRKIAPLVGGSAAFRQFLGSELMPAIDARYRTTPERAIVGESLAGLFVVETFFVEPALFDTYIAFDPSLWWNNEQLVDSASSRLPRGEPKTLYLASSGQPDLARLSRKLVDAIRPSAPASLAMHYEPMPQETHATIYHPAALLAFRRLFKPTTSGGGAASPGASSLLGTWRLVSYVTWDSAGKEPSHPLGTTPSGYASFDAGRVFIQLMRPKAVASFGAYYGTYTVDSTARTVRISVEGTNIPGYEGSVQVRPFRIRGDTLVLGVPGEYQATLLRVRD